MGRQETEKKKKQICVGLLAHVDAGKTTLSEALLYKTGSIRKMGRVDNQDAFLDTDALERARGITIFAKQAVCSLGNFQVTLLDTPGHVDFSAEMERTLQVLDYAILVINGADGVQGHTRTLWRLLKRCEIPTFLFINKMDQNGTDRTQILEDLKKRLDGNFVDFGGWSAGEGEVYPEKEQTDEFLESIAVCDENLLEAYLETGEIEKREICRLIRERQVFPCYFGSALKTEGIDSFLEGLSEYMEAFEYGEEFGAKVYKISRDADGSRLTHLKITGGRLKVKEFLPGTEKEKVNQIRIYSGSKYETVSEAEAGCVCAVTGPVSTCAGQGLGAETQWYVPVLEPVLTYQMILPPECDLHKSLKELQTLEEEEPELHIVWDEGAGEIKAQLMGEVQIEILKSRIRERFGFDVEFGTGSIVYKETLLEPVEGVGHFEPLRHYAEVHLLMEPGERGSGLVFDTRCSEDELDRNWQRLILTHLEEREHRGVLTGSPITDMKITLIAGRAHLKHTEGGDFRQATYRAVRQGLREGKCQLLEPYYQFLLELPTENLGRAMADMERMQGTFDPPVTQGDTSFLTGSAPVAAMRDYAREVISYTRGRGRLTVSVKGYEPCKNEKEIIEAIGYDPEADMENPTGSVFCSHGAGYLVPWNEVKSHMHVESPLEKEKKAEAEALEREKSVQERARLSNGGGGSWGMDKELEEIFIRTFGEPKRRTADGPRVVSAPSEKKRKGSFHKADDSGKEADGQEEYLLVDGYNIIFAWEELRELSKVTIDGARQKLMDILCNYQGWKKCNLIVVFDAYKVEGNPGEAVDYHNIHVVYTKEAETADQYIEKFAHKMGRKYHVTVATSDGLEQLIIYGQGCRLLSARDLKEDIEWVSKQVKEEKEKLKKPEKNYLFQGVDENLSAYLEEVRLGRKK